MIRVFSFILLVGVLISCRSSNFTPEVQSLYDEVMEVHDVIMPEMGTIHKLKKQLKELTPEAKNTDDVKKLITSLEKSGEGMMDWMAEFKVPKDSDTEAQIDFLLNEKTKIEIVKESMESAINNARDYLNKTEQ